jgi:hypothetical protein
MNDTRVKKTYGGSAFDRVWRQMRERQAKFGLVPLVTRAEARFWFHEGEKELQRIQSAKLLREKKNEPQNSQEKEIQNHDRNESCK